MEKKVRLEGISRRGFERRWIKVFVKGIARDDVRRCIEDQYIWHAFSYRLIDEKQYLEGEAAMEAFSLVEKINVYCLLPFMRKKVIQLPDEYRDPHLINMECGEIYVVPDDFSWTYIKTHECDFCGPYFMYAE